MSGAVEIDLCFRFREGGWIRVSSFWSFFPKFPILSTSQRHMVTLNSDGAVQLFLLIPSHLDEVLWLGSWTDRCHRP